MPKRTSIVLASRHERAIKRVMVEEDFSTQTETISYMLDRALEYMRHENLIEHVGLKTFYYLRQLARERGDDFVREIEHSFTEVKDDMLESLKDGVEHVGR